MRYRLYILISIIVFLPYDNAKTWQPCMPFCDTMCTGVAAINLTNAAIASYAEMNAALTNQNMAISSLASSLTQQQASLYSTEFTNSASFITALDGFAKRVSLVTEQVGIVNARLSEHFVKELVRLMKRLRNADTAIDVGMLNQMSKVLFANDATNAIEQLENLLADSDRRVKEAAIHQALRTKQIGTNNITNQQLGMLTEIDFDIANPFSRPRLSVEYWKNYQDYMFFTFNFIPFTSINTMDERVSQAKRTLALHTLSTLLDGHLETTESNLLPLVSSSAPETQQAILFEQYKRLLIDIDTQTNVKALKIEPLLMMKNIQLAQKNFLLNELVVTKRMKNVLLAIDN